jgi:hypothetical protein
MYGVIVDGLRERGIFISEFDGDPDAEISVDYFYDMDRDRDDEVLVRALSLLGERIAASGCRRFLHDRASNSPLFVSEMSHDRRVRISVMGSWPEDARPEAKLPSSTVWHHDT